MTERNESRTNGELNPQGSSLRTSSDLIVKTLPVTFNTPEKQNKTKQRRRKPKVWAVFSGWLGEGEQRNPCILLMFQDGVVKAFLL